MNRYYKMRGKIAKNDNYINFYRMVRLIGKNNYCPSNKRFLCGLDVIIHRLNRHNIVGVSKTEIRSLMRANKILFRKSYDMSRRTDHILNAMNDLFKEALFKEEHKVVRLTQKHFKKESFCRNQLISGLDDKLDHLVDSSPRRRVEEVTLFKDNVQRVQTVC